MYEPIVSTRKIPHQYFRWWRRYLCLGTRLVNSFYSHSKCSWFDQEAAVKRNLPIVSAITAVELSVGSSVLLVVHEGIYNETANHSLLSEFQLREFGVQIDSTCHRHAGTQEMVIQGDDESVVVPLELSGCMIHFKHRLPTTEEIESLKQYCLTQGDTPWNPSFFSDQAADKFYQQVIDNEETNSFNTKFDSSSNHKMESIRQGIPL